MIFHRAPVPPLATGLAGRTSFLLMTTSVVSSHWYEPEIWHFTSAAILSMIFATLS